MQYMPTEAINGQVNYPTAEFKGRLRLKFIIWISTILIITFGGATYYIYSTQQQHLESSLKSKAYALGQFITLISPDALYSYDVTTLDSFVQQISYDVDVLFAQIRSAENHPITTFLPEKIDARKIDQYAAQSPGLTSFIQDHNSNLILLKFDIKDGDIILGRLMIGLDTTRIEIITRNATIKLIQIYSLIVVFLGSVIFIIFKFQVLNPVNALTKGATSVADGDFDGDVPIVSHDELGKLADSFNKMRREIKSDREKLIGVNLQLEHEVEFRQKASKELKKLSLAVEQSPASVIITDLNGIIEYVNPKFSEVSGYQAEEVIGQHSRMLSADISDTDLFKNLWDTIEHGNTWKGEFCNKKKNGTIYWESAIITPIRDNNNVTTHYLAVKEDITERKVIEEQLLEQATHDQLTKLPNRFLAFDRLEQLIQRAKRTHSHIAIIYIDLDNFKNVNDSMGHSVGDQLLIKISKRIKEQLRTEDTLARLGGDEFVALVPNVTDLSSDLERVVTRLIDTTEMPVTLNNRKISISSSLGISIYPQDGTSVSTLMSNADIAMYEAKHAGRNTFRFFTKELNKKVTEKMLLESQLNHALELDEFYLVYQPIINIKTDKVVAAEVLLRWNNSELGNVPPAEFVPIAEQSGLIRPITDWLFQKILEDCKSWDNRPDAFWLSVNVPPNYFCDVSFTKTISRIFKQAKTIGIGLCIEITENLLLHRSEDVFNNFFHLQKLGIASAMDDFGTGYSSLSYIKRFPLNHLKIDRSFIKGLPHDKNNKVLTETITIMGNKFGMSIIAEGVEKSDQLEYLRTLDITFAQGFIYAKPMRPEDFSHYLVSSESQPVLS
jgi:diguanylate cyclase (GGDEF)-like protein/PAS domain S-box-containing protein